jgi:hypothetical protein
VLITTHVCAAHPDELLVASTPQLHHAHRAQLNLLQEIVDNDSDDDFDAMSLDVEDQDDAVIAVDDDESEDEAPKPKPAKRVKTSAPAAAAKGKANKAVPAKGRGKKDRPAMVIEKGTQETTEKKRKLPGSMVSWVRHAGQQPRSVQLQSEGSLMPRAPRSCLASA